MKINIAGLNIYYEVQGKGDPVILLHGWGADSGSLRNVSTLLKENTASRVYALDLPGFGYSDAPVLPWSVDDYVRFLLSFMQALDMKEVALLGHSFGGRIAIKLAAQHPEKVAQLILVDSAGIKPRRTAGYYLRVYWAKALKHLTRFLPALKDTRLFQALTSKMGSADYRGAGATMRATLVKVVNEELRDYLPHIHCPTLLVWGEKDQATPVSDAYIMKCMIPAASLEIIKNAGHFSYLDNFDAFSKIILNFWKR
jgi:pimeloyl-ACP methyl ester carboxylesterase